MGDRVSDDPCVNETRIGPERVALVAAAEVATVAAVTVTALVVAAFAGSLRGRDLPAG